MPRKEQIKYALKYTAGTYADVVLTIPIATAEYIYKGLEKTAEITGRKSPSFEDMKQKSQLYRFRENLREKLDTHPGSIFFQSTALSSIPPFLIGNYLVPSFFDRDANIPLTISAAQAITGYLVFLGNEIRKNRQKYVNGNNKLSPKKICKGLWQTAKNFMVLDASYYLIKADLQTFGLLPDALGSNAVQTSKSLDILAATLGPAVSIPTIGLFGKMIETNKTKEIYQEKNK